MNDSDSKDLHAKLRAWRVSPEVPASFQREVWQRIAARQAAREEAFWPVLIHKFFTRIASPQYAVALVMLSLVTSIGIAHSRAREANEKQWKQLEARYADSVNPLAMAH